MLNQQVCFVVYRYNHHSPHSGYSRLAEYGANQLNGKVIRVVKPLPRSIVRERVLWRLAKGTPGYDRSAMAAELNVAWHMLTDQNHIYHFLYGETTYHYSGQLNNFRNNRIVATFHQPPVGIQAAVQMDWHIRQLSAVVCVGTSQQEFFSGKIDPDRVFFVPLGIDTEYYTPPESFETRNPNLCIFVGENYRDFPTLRGVIELVSYLRPETQFVGVMPRHSFQYIGTHPSLRLLSGISETEFLNLYRSAALMIMPVHDATANNAILESMSCGLPLVVSDVGSIRDYVNSECSALVKPHDSQYMAEAILDLLNEPRERLRMSEKCRAQAWKFSWDNVIKQLSCVYQKIA